MADSIHEAVLDAAKAAVIAGGVSGITSDRVHKYAVEDLTNVVFPCVLVTLDHVRETVGPYSTDEDIRTLPVVVALLDRQDRKESAAWMPGWLQRRQALIDTFLTKVMADVAGCWVVGIEATPVIDLQRLLGKGYEHLVGAFTLTPEVITARTSEAV